MISLKRILEVKEVRVNIPERSFDELTGAALDFEQVKQGMKTEVQQLERLKVGRCLVERDGRALAKEKASHGLDLTLGINPKDLRNRSVSPCSARLRYGRDLSFECWDLRSNVVVGRASLCARSFRGERSQFADC